MKSKLRKFLLKTTAVSMAFSIIVSVPAYANIENLQMPISEEEIITLPPQEENLKETTVYIVGDSTACEYDYDENYAIPRAGWGMYLSDFLSDKATVVDLALGGRSSKSFTAEENYTKLKENLKEGDYLLIQFGHNDAKNKTEEDIANRYTNPEGDKETEGSFQNSLYENYIKLAQEKGATPILISPVSRRKFDKNNKITDSHALYDDAVRALASDTHVDFIDMTKVTEDLYNELGPDVSKAYHAAYNDTTKNVDNTHFNTFGAYNIAALIASGCESLSQYISFKQEPELTRGEFVESLMRAIKEPEPSDVENFKDVKTSSSYAAAIAAAKKANIARGDANGNFNPENKITLQDAIILTMRTLKYKNVDYPSADTSKIEDLALPQYVIQDYCDCVNLINISINENKLGGKMGYNDLADSLNKNIPFFAKDIFLSAVYGLVSEQEQAKTVEQDLNDLEKVENTK